MKTLDEVIVALEVCTSGYCSHPKHGDCPYLDERYDCDTRQRKLDALHYLKAYKEDKNDLTALRAYWKEMQDFYRNDPLTWDELRQMEGKPVWIETDNVKFWTLVDNFRIICNQECLCCSKGYMCRSTYARGDWQAYRKEHG